MKLIIITAMAASIGNLAFGWNSGEIIMLVTATFIADATIKRYWT